MRRALAIAALTLVPALGACSTGAVDRCVDLRLEAMAAYEQAVDAYVAAGIPQDAAKVIVKRDIDVDERTRTCLADR